LHRLFLREWAEDATSDTFLHMARSIRDFAGRSLDEFRFWLYRIATNQVNAMIRTRLRRRKLLRQACRQGRLNADGTCQAGDNGHLDWPHLHAAIARLSARDQTLIVLRYLEDKPPAEIAEILEIPAGTVRVGLCRALKRLQNRLAGREARPAGRNPS
jgi:RNA polymerase sigma-70 factor (ECF subfamily)